METYSKALVLSGGSVKGAFQAGALAEVLKMYVPDAIYGITVGSLNGLFLMNEAGKAVLENKKPDWPEIGQKVADFWIQNITKPESIAIRRKGLALGFQILTRNFKGLTDNQPMRNLIYTSVKPENIMASPIHFSAGCTNVATAELIYADRSFPDFLEYVVASVAEPLTMPHVEIQGKSMIDGIPRVSSPIGEAIRLGAEKIMAVDCHSISINEVQVNMGNLVEGSKRISNIMTWNQQSRDMEAAHLINELVKLGQGSNRDSRAYGKRLLEIKSIQPVKDPGIDIAKFTSEEIRKLVQNGKEVAKERLANFSWGA